MRVNKGKGKGSGTAGVKLLENGGLGGEETRVSGKIN